MKLKQSIWILLLIGLYGCKKAPEKKDQIAKEPKVVNFDNKLAFQECSKMNLDSTYTNLLDPRNVSESEHRSVIKSWTEFHQKVSKFIKEENFNWEVPDSTISVLNRIYFDKNGNIDYYAFKILNPSIPAEKQSEFENILEKFSKEIKLDLKRDKQYAQCGKAKYLNY